VPIGGIVAGFIGAIDGDIMGQIVGGQIGGRSIELLHNGCIRPSTHWHIHSARAGKTKMIAAKPSIVTAVFTTAQALNSFTEEYCSISAANAKAVPLLAIGTSV
jgi:hypothetical protein